ELRRRGRGPAEGAVRARPFQPQRGRAGGDGGGNRRDRELAGGPGRERSGGGGVKGRLARIGAAVLVATTILLALVVLVPSRRSLFIGIYELVLAAIAIGTLVRSFRMFEPQAWRLSPCERG